MKNKFSALWVFLASLLWAADAPFRKPLLTAGLGVGYVAFLEHIFNTCASLPLLFKQRAEFKNISKKQWLGFFYVGAVASALAAIIFVKGAVTMHYNFTVAALLQKLQPFFAIFLAAIFLKEKISRKFWFMALPAFFGAYLVSFDWNFPTAYLQTLAGVSPLGPCLAVLAALFWAGGTVVGKSLLKDLDFRFVTGVRFLFGLVFLIFYVSIFENFQFAEMTYVLWRNTFVISMFTGFFALSLYYFGLKHTRVSVATFMELGYPFALTVVNWIFLDIKLSLAQIFGALVLILAVSFMVKEKSKLEAKI